MANQILLQSQEILFTPHLQKRQVPLLETGLHVSGELSGVKRDDLRLQLEVDRPSYRVETGRQAKGLWLPQDTLVTIFQRTRRRHAIQIAAGWRMARVLLPVLAIAVSKVAQCGGSLLRHSYSHF
ncbi:hypothetical protein PANT111_140132 [Pantoea brenneri]|uniref:Uncharacterized protein n=1 Tax=Pantoea brenneri TaxID=472694 RepID=A0AAX3J3F4_9GAMM|nr:hypothetical protein PANT111_140132 [Pantoea brenneri]